MAAGRFADPVGDRRKQWQQIYRNCRSNLEDADGHRSVSRLNVDSRDRLEDVLRDVSIDDTDVSLNDRLSPALETVQTFATILINVSPYDLISGLVWCGFWSMVDATADSYRPVRNLYSRSKVIPEAVVKLLIEVAESIPGLDQYDHKLYRFNAVQYALQDLFEQYINLCTKLSSHLQNLSPGSMIDDLSPTLDQFDFGLSRAIRKLRDAMADQLMFATTRTDAEIVGTIPEGISDMPPSLESSSSTASNVEFPVDTVNMSRNGAFVGRKELLDKLAIEIDNSRAARRDQNSIDPPLNRENDIGYHTRSRSSTKSISAAAVASSSRQNADRVKSRRGIKTTPVMCVLHGLGGVGKTQLALQYFYEHRGEIDGIFWMNAEQTWQLAQSYAKIADKLNLLIKKTIEDGSANLQNEAIEKARNWLQTTDRGWLLIFDNVGDFKELGRYLPTETVSGGAVIVTTQSPTIPSWINNAKLIHVEALDQESAADCIFRYLDRNPVDDAERDLACEIAAHVGCLPLAMATIGGFVKQSQVSLEEFFENVKKTATLWEKSRRIDATHEYTKSLISVFETAFNDLSDKARELLNILAFLDPDSIPEEIFDKAIDTGQFKYIKTSRDFHDCYFELRSRQLIHRDTSNSAWQLSIHRVVQWNVLLDLSRNHQHRWECFQQAFELVKAVLPKTDPTVVPEADKWPSYARHGRQMLELRNHCLWPDPPVQLPMAFAEILAEMGTYMWFSGKFPEGVRALTTAEQILDESQTKPGHRLRAHTYQILGIITSFEGVSQRQRSMDFRKHAYHARQLDLGQKPENERTRDENIMIWAMHSDMAYAFIQEEDFDQTATYMEECHEKYQQWEKDELEIPYEYAKYYQLMAYCWMAEQRPRKAMNAINRCYELTKKAAGNNHSFTQLIKFCHANLLWHSKGKQAREEALKINKAVLQFRKDLVGEFSHFTLESFSTCGKLCTEAGELDEAKGYLDACLERRKRAVWNDEGITRAQYRYSRLLYRLEARARAEGNEVDAQAFLDDADRLTREVEEVVRKHRKAHVKYLKHVPEEDTEANLDQMVSIWAGRFTGRLKQVGTDLSFLDDYESESMHRPTKRRRREHHS